MRHAFLLLSNWNFGFRVRAFALLVLLGIAAGTSARAQDLVLSVSTPTNFVRINDSVLFTIDVTNRTGSLLTGVFVTNSLTGTASTQIIGATNSQGPFATNSPTNISFSLGNLADADVARMSVVVRPTSGGIFTNFVILMVSTSTNPLSTSVAVEVAPPTADLAVSLIPPVAPILVNDVITYRVGVTNLGTNSVSNVVLTNGDFSSMILKSLSPATNFTRTNGQLVLNLGTLAGKAGKSFLITAQPTNAGPLTISAAVTATNAAEVNASNNFVSANFTVEALVTGDLVASNFSTMTYNPQTGLMQQTVRLSNVGSNTVAGARVFVTGLSNRLYNAVGTNSGNPFVVYSASLNAGASANLLMEYFNPSRQIFTVADSNYIAAATSAVNLAGTGSTNVAVLITNLGAAGILIEFPSTPNRSYTIFYSPDTSFTNALTAQPSIVAPANRTQWIDNGPPKTIRHPSDDPARFYRVQLNP